MSDDSELVERVQAAIHKEVGEPSVFPDYYQHAAHAAIAEVQRWQPIETAPHGVDVLLGWIGWHSKEWNCEVGQASRGWTRNGISTMSRHGSATHWMPLPAPPKD